jgi:hypothetical protein
MKNKFTVFQGKDVASENNGLLWKIRSVKKTNECTVISDSVINGSEFITTIKPSKECPDLLHDISNDSHIVKRLGIGKNPVLSTKNCKEITWLY